MAQLIKGETGEWEIVIGMEVHAQVTAQSKLFSGASTQFGAEPNSQVSLVDAAMPGMLPVLNEYCVEQAVRTGLGLKAQINNTSVFERKNYFYPDLPQGYQISQFLHPIVGKGAIEIDLPDGSVKMIGITRLHLEQDAGKSLHDQHPSKSFVDLNRSGCALMEIVSEPDIRGPEEAVAYLSKLRIILQYLGTCNGNMEEGSMRADVNVSVRKPGDPLGTRAEIKNVNSLKAVQMAVDYEVQRQIEIIEGGGTIDQETRLWDPGKGATRSMRSKEEAHDYRYFPDPDLLPLVLNDNFIDGIRKTLPELPDDKKNRFKDDFGLSIYDASVLIAEQKRAKYFEDALEILVQEYGFKLSEINDEEEISADSYPEYLKKAAKSAGDKARRKNIAQVLAKEVANKISNDLLGLLNKDNKAITESPIKPTQLAELINITIKEIISGKIAKDVFAIMYETGKDPAAIVEEKGLRQVTDTGAIEKIVDEVLAENPDKVAEYKSGKDKLFGFFVGQVMKKSGGKMNPAAINDLLKAKLSG